MTNEQSVEHWRKGAQDALEAAELLLQGKKHALALFHCHLAAEKALKAAYIQQKDARPPHSHDLLEIALSLSYPWSEDIQKQLRELSTYAIEARYDDIEWEHDPNEDVQWWITMVTNLLQQLQNG